MTYMIHANFAAMRGFSLVAAIFVLVVLAALGVFIVTIGEAQRSTATAALQGTRTYYAAQSGIEWGIAQTVPLGGGFSCAAGASSFAVGDFTVTVTRAPAAGNPYTEGGFTTNVCTITSAAVMTGVAFGTLDYFSRTLQVTVTDAPGS